MWGLDVLFRRNQSAAESEPVEAPILITKQADGFASCVGNADDELGEETNKLAGGELQLLDRAENEPKVSVAFSFGFVNSVSQWLTEIEKMVIFPDIAGVEVSWPPKVFDTPVVFQGGVFQGGVGSRIGTIRTYEFATKQSNIRAVLGMIQSVMIVSGNERIAASIDGISIWVAR